MSSGFLYKVKCATNPTESRHHHGLDIKDYDTSHAAQTFRPIMHLEQCPAVGSSRLSTSRALGEQSAKAAGSPRASCAKPHSHTVTVAPQVARYA